MKKNKKKLLLIFFIILSIFSITLNSYAHSGRTDSNGGHKDNKNKSGLGSYHYHCGGNPPHLHENGVCPYSSTKNTKSNNSTSNSSSSNNSKSSSSSSNKSTSNKSTKTDSSSSAVSSEPKTIDITSIKINENVESLNVGEKKQLTVTLEPTNATKKEVSWKSSDTNIATVSTTGEVLAIKSGFVNITASTYNGKTSSIQLEIKEDPATIPTSISVDNTNITNSSYKSNSPNPLSIFVGIVFLGGGLYWIYNKFNK